MGSCPCSGFTSDAHPDIDQERFHRHVRERLLPSLELENNPLHLTVIEKDLNKLKRQLKKQRDGINVLDHHGYTPLHLAVLLKWNKGIDLLLSYYASPIISSSSGWTPLDEAIATKQVEVYQKLAEALKKHLGQYSKQNVAKIYTQLTQTRDFYIEMKLESFAIGLTSVTGHYFPSDTLKIWKKEGMVRVDMTLLDYDYDKKEWIRGNVSHVFMVKKSGSFDLYYIDHVDKTVHLEPNKPLVNYDNIPFDLSNVSSKKPLFKPVKSRKIEIKQAQYQRAKSWLGNEEAEVIDDVKCEVFKATDIQFVTKYRNQHIPKHKRKHIKNDSSIVSLIIYGDDEDEDDIDQDEKYDVNEIECDYIAPQILVDDYMKIKDGDVKIREKANKNMLRFDADESFVLNTAQTEQSQTSYNMSIFMAEGFGISIDEIVVIFDLIGVQSSHMNNVKRILQLTGYDEDKFPLCLEMPLLLNVVRAKITFQSLNRDPIDRKIFEIPRAYKR